MGSGWTSEADGEVEYLKWGIQWGNVGEREPKRKREHTRKKRVGVRENIGDDCIKVSERDK